MSNGFSERWHRSLHTGLSHYINATNIDWDTLIPFFLMAYRATPNSVTGYSPFYLLHGRKMEIPNNDNLKARIPSRNPDLDSHIRKLKASLKKAYEIVAKSNRNHINTTKNCRQKSKITYIWRERSGLPIQSCNEIRLNTKILSALDWTIKITKI